MFGFLFDLFFKIEFNPLPDLLNTGFAIIEIGLFYGGENLKAKICSIQTFLDNMAAYLSSQTTTNKKASNTSLVLLIFIKTFNLLPKHSHPATNP